MTTIKTIAHLNELTREVSNDYYLQPESKGTLTLADIIKRLEAKEIATKNVNGEAFVKQALHEIVAATLEGYNVDTGAFNTAISIRGAVQAQDLGHTIPSDKVHARIHFEQGAAARAAVKDASVHVAEQPAPTGPVIQLVTNPVVNEPHTLNAGQMALLKGMRLTVAGDKTDETGVYFTPAAGSGNAVRIPAGALSPNQPSKLQFVLPPEVTPGSWMVKVASQWMSHSTVFTKYVRVYEYPMPVTVL
jgi:hypothetical protein